MTALAGDRLQSWIPVKDQAYDVEASTRIWAGALVGLNAAGNAVPATAVAGLIIVGVAKSRKDNRDGLAAALKVDCRTGGFPFINGETITKAHIGDMAYAMDDQTVGRTATGRSPVGPIVNIDSEGVWVKTGILPPDLT